MWTWRAAAINRGSTLLALIVEERDRSFDVFIQDLEGTNHFRLSSFRRIPQTKGDPSLVNRNLVWINDTQLAIASGSGQTENPYCLELFDVSTRRRLARTNVPSTNWTVFVNLTLSPAENGALWFSCAEEYEFKNSLDSWRLIDPRTSEYATIRRDYGWSGRLALGHYVVQVEPGHFEIQEQSETRDKVARSKDTIAVLDNANRDYSYLLLKEPSRGVRSVIIDRKTQGLIEDVPLHPVCWVD
jgi:hypothetical protein